MARTDDQLLDTLVPTLGWLFLLFAGLTTIHTARDVWLNLRIKSWVEVPAHVSKLEVEQTKRKRSSSPGHRPSGSRWNFKPVTAYTYAWEGKTREGMRFAAHSVSSGSSQYPNLRVNEVRKRMGRDGNSFCFVNPANPDESVLSRENRWTNHSIQFFIAAALMTFGVGLTHLNPGKEAKEKSALRAKHPAEAWMWRADWARGEAENGAAFPTNTAACAVAWLVMTCTPLVLSRLHPSTVPDPITFWLYLAPLPAILLGWLAIKFARDFRTFGVLRLRFDRVPVHPGDVLSAHLVVPVPLDKATRIKHTLTCTRWEDGHVRKGRKTSVQRTLFEKKWETPPPETGADGTCRLDIRMPIPEDAPGMNPLGMDDDVKWELELEADLPGIEFEHDFGIPIFNRHAETAPTPG